MSIGIDEFISITQNSKNIDKIILTGGEFFLHPDWNLIVRYLIDKKIPHIIYTNGQCDLTDDGFDLLLNDEYLINITVSLHSSDGVEHNRITKKADSFSKSVEFIKKIANKTCVVTNTVITDQSPASYEDLLLFVQSIGASMAGFTRCFDFEYSQKKYLGIISRAKDLIRTANNLNLDDFIDIDCFSYCEIGPHSQPCFSARTFYSIDTNGDVYPCIFSDKLLGNVFLDTWDEIVNSSGAKEWRVINDNCMDCLAFSSCCGGCGNMKHKQPIDGNRDEIVDIRINQDWKIQSNFNIANCDSGFFIFNGKKAKYFTDEYYQLIEYINGASTIMEVIRKFGHADVRHLLDLQLNGFISFC